MDVCDLDYPRYQLADLARLTGRDANTIRAWFDRGIIPIGDADRAAGGSGRPRILSARRVLQVVTGHELVLLNIPPNAAYAAAGMWTDAAPGYGPGIHEPGRPFPTGRTLLVVTPRVGEPGEWDARVINAEMHDGPYKILGRSRSAAIVDVGEVYRRTLADLHDKRSRSEQAKAEAE